MSTNQVHHPLFARFYRCLSAGAEKVGGAEHRDELLAGLVGRVIEVGAGHGINFVHYPEAVTELVAVEPEAYLRAAADKAAAKAQVPVEVVDGTADHLPVPDASFDAGVVSLVLCSVPDQAAALAELHRVIRPGGELRFYEHVRAASPRRARRQDRMQPLWSRLAGGCRPNRRTEAAISAAGFTVADCRRFNFEPCFLAALTAPIILGRARRD
ncbi:MAG: class I SAM-dependent methyltransferase [Acidimicrobiales bacterium]